METIILVHGTKLSNDDNCLTWWHPHSTGHPFQKKLHDALSKFGSPARCWAHLDWNAKPFEWSGRLSEVDRKQRAAWSFSKYLRNLEKDSRVTKYHIICHSFGGYVVRRSLCELAMRGETTISKLGTVVFLGVPFILNRLDRITLRFLIPYRNWSLSGAFALFTIAALTLTIDLHTSPAGSIGLALLLVLGGLFLFGFWMLGYKWQRVANPNCRCVVVSSRYDEAIFTIKKLVELRERGGFFHYFRGNFLSPLKREFRIGFIWAIPVVDNLLRRVPWQILVHDLRRLSRRKVFSTESRNVALMHARVLSLILIVLPVTTLALLLVYVVGQLITLLRSIFALAKAWLLAKGVRGLIAAALGEDVAFDRIIGVADLPQELEGETERWELSDDLEKELLSTAVDDLQTQTHEVYLLMARSIVHVAQFMAEFLTNTHLVHFQYMRNQKVIEIIAQKIALADEKS